MRKKSFTGKILGTLQHLEGMKKKMESNKRDWEEMTKSWEQTTKQNKTKTWEYDILVAEVRKQNMYLSLCFSIGIDQLSKYYWGVE